MSPSIPKVLIAALLLAGSTSPVFAAYLPNLPSGDFYDKYGIPAVSGSVEYCEALNFDLIAPSMNGTNVNITIFYKPTTYWGDQGLRRNDTVIERLLTNATLPVGFIWHVDVPAGTSIMIEIIAQAGSSMKSYGTQRALNVTTTSKPCNQSLLALPYNAASVVASTGLRSISSRNGLLASGLVIAAGLITLL